MSEPLRPCRTIKDLLELIDEVLGDDEDNEETSDDDD